MKSLVLLTFIALSQARFGQEQIPIDAIRQVKGGSPGASDTIAGAAISDLLAAADPCAKLQRGDQILTELGEGSDAVAAAIGMVAAEKNFNPFSTGQPSICNDASLPQNALLRGITPKIDPAVVGADVANALSARTVTKPLEAAGKSVADLLSENGFTNFTTSGTKSKTDSAQSGRGDSKPSKASPMTAANVTTPDAAAAAPPPPPPPAGSAITPPAPPSKSMGNETVAAPVAPSAPPSKAAGNETLPEAAVAPPASSCTCTCAAHNAAAANANANATTSAAATATASAGMGKKKKEKAAAASASAAAAAAAATGKDAASNDTGVGKGVAANTNGADNFGSCDPTISFEAGRAGRKATEFTFQSNDAVIAANQQDALNPNIITNRICDELTNICNANAAAKATCLAAKAQILALGTRDQSTADAWNALVGGKKARRSRRRA